MNKTYAFRTASLRNLSTTAPYMHNGAFATLPDVVDFYRRIGRGGGRRGGGGGGGARGINPQVARDQIDPLRPPAEHAWTGRTGFVAFLRALDDPEFDRSIPEHVPRGCQSAAGYSGSGQRAYIRMKQQDSTVTALRRLLLGLLLFGLAGTATELLLISHDEDIWQTIPIVAIALAVLVSIGLAATSRATPPAVLMRSFRG